MFVAVRDIIETTYINWY